VKRFDWHEGVAARLKDETRDPVAGASVDEWYNAAPHMRSASLFQQQLGCVTPGLSDWRPACRTVASCRSIPTAA